MSKERKEQNINRRHKEILKMQERAMAAYYSGDRALVDALDDKIIRAHDQLEQIIGLDPKWF